MSEPFDLQPLVTQCPNCHTQFRVNEAQLQVANGKVRCGACLTVFQGVDNLIWEQGDDLEKAADSGLDDLLEELENVDDEALANAEADNDNPLLDASTENALQQLGELDAPEQELTLEPVTPPGEQVPAPEASRDPAEALAAAVAATFSQPQTASDQPAESAAPAQLQADAEPERDIASDPEPEIETIELEALEAPDSSGDSLTEVKADVEGEAEATIELELEPLANDAPVTAEPSARATGAEEIQPPEAVTKTPTPVPPPAAETPPPAAQVAASAAATPEADPPAEAELAPEPDPFERLSANKGDELPSPGGERGWMLYAVSIAGVLLLVVQVLIFRFDAWSQDPSLRPIYTSLCPIVGCTVPPMQALDQMSSRNLTVRTHPSVPGALMVDTVIVNSADFAQAFPVLELTFTDINDKVVAGRRFEPEEYLAGELAGAKNIASRTPVRIKLEIKDPGPAAVSYKMDFR